MGRCCCGHPLPTPFMPRNQRSSSQPCQSLSSVSGKNWKLRNHSNQVEALLKVLELIIYFYRLNFLLHLMIKGPWCFCYHLTQKCLRILEIRGFLKSSLLSSSSHPFGFQIESNVDGGSQHHYSYHHCKIIPNYIISLFRRSSVHWVQHNPLTSSR